MTKISYIAGVGANEYKDRGNNVSANQFVPYLSLTSGEMLLMLAAQRAKIYADFYPEAKQFQRGAALLDNALNSGISGGVNFVGALHDPYLQRVARAIKMASRMTAPASGSVFSRENVMSGIGEVIPAEARKQACQAAATAMILKRPECRFPPYAPGSVCAKLLDSETRQCEKAFKIENILNGGIENSGHHVVYKSLPSNFQLPTEVVVKRTLHKTGVEGMALVGKIQTGLMYEWVENAIILKNTKIGVGPIKSPVTSLYLAPDPMAEMDKYNKLSRDRGDAIGIDPATTAIVIKVVGGIVAAITAAATLLKQLRSEEAYAMSEARGFGTEAFSGSKQDWLLSQQNQPVAAESGLSTPLLLGGAALAAWALLK